jgi:hypothetical protein
MRVSLPQKRSVPGSPKSLLVLASLQRQQQPADDREWRSEKGRVVVRFGSNINLEGRALRRGAFVDAHADQQDMNTIGRKSAISDFFFDK